MASYKYDIVLSYAGEDEHHAKQLSQFFDQKKIHGKKVRVLSVKHTEDGIRTQPINEIWGKYNVDSLYEISYNKGRLFVPFLSKVYYERAYSGFAVTTAQQRAVANKNEAYIHPIQVDKDVEIDSYLTLIGFASIKDGPRKIGEALLQILAKSSGHPHTSSNFLSSASNVIDALKKTMVQNTCYQRLNDKRGGWISLLRIGLDLCNETKLDKAKERAFCSFLKIAFEAAIDTLQEIRDLYSIDESNLENPIEDKYETMEEILAASKNTPNWNSYLPDYPGVQKIKKSILNFIEKTFGPDNHKIRNYFNTMFNMNLEEKIEDEASIISVKDVFYHVHSSELHRYLLDVKNYDRRYKETMEEPEFNKVPLYKCYIRQLGVEVGHESWNSKLDELEEQNKPKFDIHKLISNFLDEKNNSKYKLIGAPFGVGKTSVMRMVASYYARRCLYADKDAINLQPDGIYIPILVYMRYGGGSVYYWRDVYTILEEIVAPSDEPESYNRKILLILDGLDEDFDENDVLSIEQLVEQKILKLGEGEKMYKNYPKMKVIITTRLKSELPQSLKLFDDHIRLLPFTINQIDEFLCRYVAADNRLNNSDVDHKKALTYDDISKRLMDDKITDDILSTPLFIWMFSLMYADFHSSEFYPKFSKMLNINMRISLMYLHFVHYIIRGMYPSHWKTGVLPYVQEKKALRAIAVVKQIKKDELTWKYIEDELKNFNINADIKEIKPFLESYFYFKPAPNGDLTIEFVNESLKHYLIAEFYVQVMMEENKEWLLNIGVREEDQNQIIKFFIGLIELLGSEEDYILSKYLKGLLASFGDDLASVKTKLEQCARRYIKNENIVCLGVARKPLEVKFWRVLSASKEDYKNLWMHRWISLLLVNRIIKNTSDEEMKEMIINVLRYSSHLIYDSIISHLNLSRIDFSGANLSYVDLAGADLSYANLARADLSYANLADADLRGSILYKATLTGANISSCKTSAETDFSHAYF